MYFLMQKDNKKQWLNLGKGSLLVWFGLLVSIDLSHGQSTTFLIEFWEGRFYGEKNGEFQDESENMSFREFEIGYLLMGVIF